MQLLRPSLFKSPGSPSRWGITSWHCHFRQYFFPSSKFHFALKYKAETGPARSKGCAEAASNFHWLKFYRYNYQYGIELLSKKGGRAGRLPSGAQGAVPASFQKARDNATA